LNPVAVTTLRHVSFAVIPVVFSLYTVYHFHLLVLLSRVSLLFSYCFFRSSWCSFFYFSVPFFRFVCLSLPHFSSFHHLLFICPLIVYFCFLTSRRLDSLSHAYCDYVFWDVTPCGFVYKYQCLGRICHLHLQGVQIGLQFHPESAG
jgi:hypothetical protein